MSEPVSEPAPEPYSEPMSEPIPEPISESVAEPISEPYPETVPDTAVFPEAEPEVTPEGEPYPLSENDVNRLEESEPPGSASPETLLDAVDFVVPPMVMVGLVLLGALATYAISHRYELREYWRHLWRPHNGEKPLLLDSESIQKLGTSETSDRIIEEMRKIPQNAQNGILPLLRIIVPCIITILFCPLLLVKANLFKDFFWQGSGDEKMNVNDALEVFLVPISLLFALMFSVSFENVLGKQSEIRVHINKEVNALYKMKALIHNLSWENDTAGAEHRQTIAKIILEQVLDLCWQLKSTAQAPPWEAPPFKGSTTRPRISLVDVFSEAMKTVKSARAKTAPGIAWRKADEENYVKTNNAYDKRLWMIVPHLKSDKHHSHTKDSLADGIMISKLLENIMDFGDIVAQRQALDALKLSLFQWGFMEALGFVTFIAILLVDASSPSCELAMCMVTAFCVALLTLVIADGDDPYHGFIRIRIPSLDLLVKDAAQDVAWMSKLLSRYQSVNQSPATKSVTTKKCSNIEKNTTMMWRARANLLEDDNSVQTSSNSNLEAVHILES